MGNMDISKVLLPEMTILDYPTFKDQADMFQFMAGKLKEHGVVSSAEKFIEALYVREGEGSTYMGQAIQKGGANDHLQMLASLARLLAHDEFFESLETVQSHEELMKAISDLQKDTLEC